MAEVQEEEGVVWEISSLPLRQEIEKTACCRYYYPTYLSPIPETPQNPQTQGFISVLKTFIPSVKGELNLVPKKFRNYGGYPQPPLYG